MTDIELRALLGDMRSQEECTRKRKQFCTGTPALCRLLDGVWNAQIVLI